MRPMLVGFALLVAAGCYSKPDDEPVSCEERPDPHCGHPIDRVLVPKLRAVKLAPRDGDASQVCRRLSIDLIGRIPTPAELDACRAQTLEQRVDALMARPEYVQQMQRGWAEAFGFDANVMWYGYAIDLDALAGRLAKGEINYTSFAAESVVHPGFYALHQGDDWAFNVIETFLGRSGRMDEVAGMRPLTRVFESRVFCDAAIWADAYSYAIGEGQSAAEATTFADDSCVGSGSEETIYNFCGCIEGEASIGCRSTTLGPLIEFGSEGCRNQENPDSTANHYRAGEHVPGLRNVCGGASRPECVDRVVDDTEKIAGPLAPANRVEAALQARLLSVGAALATREDFWEAAADRELKRFIGWWKDGIRRPDFDLPAVRTLLARELYKTGDVRSIQKLILTSLLYAGDPTPPPRVPASAEAPLWSMGSTKILAAESWLDSAAIATLDRPLGYCDYRFVAIGEVGPGNVAESVVRRVPSPLASLFDEERYLGAAQMLGGCTADSARPRISTVGMTYAEHDVARTLCAASTLVLPPGFVATDASDASLQPAIRELVRRTLSREATVEELDTFATEMRECIAAGPDQGCASAEVAVRWLCTRIVDSAEFALY